MGIVTRITQIATDSTEKGIVTLMRRIERISADKFYNRPTDSTDLAQISTEKGIVTLMRRIERISTDEIEF